MRWTKRTGLTAGLILTAQALLLMGGCQGREPHPAPAPAPTPAGTYNEPAPPGGGGQTYTAPRALYQPWSRLADGDPRAHRPGHAGRDAGASTGANTGPDTGACAAKENEHPG